MNEIRNELLLILDTAKAEDEHDKNFKLEWLLDRFESDLRRQMSDLKYKQEQLESNFETLEYVRKELRKGEK